MAVTINEINDMKEMIQNLRIWFMNNNISHDKQQLFRLRDIITNINLESQLLLDKIEKRLIFI